MEKREKRRWIFRKTVNQETVRTPPKVKPEVNATGFSTTDDVSPAAASTADQKQALAVAMATAEAAMATAQVAVEAARLSRPAPNNLAREHRAAIVIQTAFRGYLVSAFHRSNQTHL